MTVEDIPRYDERCYHGTDRNDKHDRILHHGSRMKFL